MNAPGGEVLEGGQVRPVSARRTMITWTGDGATRLEAVRATLGERALRATGSIVSAADDALEAFSASYSLATDELGVFSRLTVRAVTASGEQHVTLNRSEESIWLVDHGEGAKRTDFDGALDVDLEFSPLFNALPVRRLDLHREPGEHDLAVVFVSLPELRVQLVRQSYRSATPGDRRVAFSAGSFTADITVDENGLVIDYPGIAHRT